MTTQSQQSQFTGFDQLIEAEIDLNIIEDWEYQSDPSDENGDSRTIGVRVHPQLEALLLDLLLDLREVGHPLQGKPDFLRFAIGRAIRTMRREIGVISDEETAHWMLTMKRAAKKSREAGLLEQAMRSVSDMVRGTRTLIQQREYIQAMARLTDWSRDIWELESSNNDLFRIYVKQLFTHDAFKEMLGTLEKSIGLTQEVQEMQEYFSETFSL